MTPLQEWIVANSERVRVSSSVDVTSDRSSATCGAGDRTIYALSAISEGEELIHLRDRAFLNGDVWMQSVEDVAGAELKGKLAELQPSGAVLTSLALLAEKSRGSSSALHGYIDQLPSKVPLPFTWSGSTRALLQHTAAEPIVDDTLVKSVFECFALPLAAAFPSLWGKEGVSFEDFRWAFAIVSSRAFSVDGSREPTLLPAIDMVNHDDANPAAEIRKNDDGSFSLVAIRAIHEGDPVTLSYGSFSNAQLLCRYGFTLPATVDSDSILLSSTHVRAVFAQLTGGGSAEAALAQLELLDKESASVSRVHDATPADDEESDAPAVKRRKLFAADTPEDSISFALHGDAAQEFGLADGLMSFVFAENLPMDSLYDVLTVLLQHKDKVYSALLDSHASGDSSGEARLALALVALERQVCRRILLGIMNLEEESDDDDVEELDGDEDGEEDEADDGDE